MHAVYFQLSVLKDKMYYFWFTPLPPSKVLFSFEHSKNLYQSQVISRRSLTTWRKRSEDGSLQTWEDYWQSSDWCALALHKVEEAKEELRKSLKRRKDIAIAKSDIQYKDFDTTQVFSNRDSKEFDAAIAELMEKNRAQAEEIRSLNMEQESQAMMLCEITEQNKREIEDRAMLEDEKINLANRLEEKSIELTKISNMQLDTLS